MERSRTVKALKNKRFALAHEVIDFREALIAEIGNNPLIDEYYQGMLKAIKAIKSIEEELGGK